jgi:Super-infection exclusion protein B
LGEFAKLVVAWFGKPVRGLGAFMLGSAAVLCLWQYQKFADAIKDPLLRWPVLILVFSAAGLVTYPVEHGWKWAHAKHKNKSLSRKIIARLANLTPHEKKVLQRYLMEESTTENWDRGGPVEALARDGILSLLASDQNPNNLKPYIYAINDVAWKQLNAHPELIDLSK